MQRDLLWVVGPSCPDGAWCSISGRLRHEALGPESFPVVGDFVRLRADAPLGAGGTGVIEAIEPRTSCLTRIAPGGGGAKQVIGANLDWVLVVTSCNQEFNVRRIERYLAVIWESGASPVVVLSKIDLVTDWRAKAAQVEALGTGVHVVGMSSVSGEGFEELTTIFNPGQTLGLVGSSGVGKSSLLNRLLGGEVQATQEVRDIDDRGRHTTTSRSLHETSRGFFVVDTPGMRELQISASEETVDELFSDIAHLGTTCRFSNCTHAEESDCAIRAALESGQLDKGRLASFRKLEREARHNAMRGNKAAMSEERRKWKQRSKAARVDRKRTYF